MESMILMALFVITGIYHLYDYGGIFVYFYLSGRELSVIYFPIWFQWFSWSVGNRKRAFVKSGSCSVFTISHCRETGLSFVLLQAQSAVTVDAISKCFKCFIFMVSYLVWIIISRLYLPTGSRTSAACGSAPEASTESASETSASTTTSDNCGGYDNGYDILFTVCFVTVSAMISFSPNPVLTVVALRRMWSPSKL